jgi:hypothetical protein
MKEDIMNIEKTLFWSVTAFTLYAGIFMAWDKETPSSPLKRHIAQSVRIEPDFDISSIIDNKPFDSFYSSEERNPFLPYIDDSLTHIPDHKGDIQDIDDTFVFSTDDKHNPDDISVHTDTVDIPDKPDDSPDDMQKVDTDIVKRDESIPVYLIGFVKTESEQDRNRKVILSHKTTGRVYTAEKGNILLGLSILEVTPYSVKMELKNGRRIEYCNDILKTGTETLNS